MHRYLKERKMLGLVTSLVAAYAIALSAILGNISSARAAATIDGQVLGLIICHTGTDPAPGDTSNADCCANACVSHIATLSPPATSPVPVIRPAELRPMPKRLSHRRISSATCPQKSRAPPIV